MPVFLFIINKITKVKVVSQLKCVPFINILHQSWGGWGSIVTVAADTLNSKNISPTEFMRVYFPMSASIEN